MKKHYFILVSLLLVNILYIYSNNNEAPNAGEDQIICSNETQLSATPVENALGYWTIISGSGTFENINDPISMVRNLSFGTNILRWTVYYSGESVLFDDVSITAYYINVDAGDDLVTCNNRISLSASEAVGFLGTWTMLQGCGEFSSVTNPKPTVYNLCNGDNIFRWTLSNEFCSFYDEVKITAYSSYSNAGSDQTISTNHTVLDANYPSATFQGTWQLISGGGTLSDIHDPKATVTDLAMGITTFAWSVENGFCFSISYVSILCVQIIAPNAGEDQIICSNETQLSATPVENALGTWTIISGSGTFDNINDPISMVKNLSFGTNIFRWTVNYSDESVLFDDVSITTYFINVNAGNDLVTCNNQISLSASEAVGFLGTWTILQGCGEFSSVTNPKPTVYNLCNGDNIFRWTLSNEFCSFYDEVKITIYYAEVNAGEDKVVCEDQTVLDANEVDDFEGTWYVISGKGTFSDIHDPKATVTDLKPGLNLFGWQLTYTYCSFFDDVVINYAFETPNAGNNMTICDNQTVLNATPPSFYQGTWHIISGGGDFSDIHDPHATVANLYQGYNIFRWTVGNETCITSDEVFIFSTKIDTSVKIEENKLISNNYIPADYQWLDCDNDFAPIEGANQQQFTPVKSGNYAVKIWTENCMEISDCYLFNYSNMTLCDFDENIVISPNPVKNQLNIKLNKSFEEIEILIYDQIGKLMFKEKHEYIQNIIIPINELAESVCFVTVIANGQKIGTYKIVKQK